MTDATDLADCPLCKQRPGTKVGPPALVRCVTPLCEGMKLGAFIPEEWNLRATAQTAVTAGAGFKAGEALGLTPSLDRDLAERHIPPTFQDELRALRKLAAIPAANTAGDVRKCPKCGRDPTLPESCNNVECPYVYS